MIKYIILVIILNAAIFVSDLFYQDIFLQINAPHQVEAGNTVDVEIQIHKAQLSGFARFQQVLPYGVTASPVYPADMNFSFEDNILKMIWLNLPQEETITIRYKVHISERLKGDLNLEGTFSYIENNQRRVAAATGSLLAIKPSLTIEERYIVDVNDANHKLIAPAPAPDRSRNIVAVRQEPVPDNESGFIVNILVNKEDQNHFAKIEETIPEGFTAVEMESKGGIFSFSDQRARIIWRNLPIETNFVVSYRIIPESGITGTPVVSGDFSFMNNGLTANRRITQMNEDVKSLSEVEKSALIASLPWENISTSISPADRPLMAGRNAQRRTGVSPGTEIRNPLQSETGIYYRVQLAAGHRPIEIERYFSRLNITDDVRSEIHDGWIKYSIGSYYNYRAARDYRVHIWNTTPINDAFVAAYNEGLRITVQEALMISNHEWYK
jgi:hypothetical protein